MLLRDDTLPSYPTVILQVLPRFSMDCTHMLLSNANKLCHAIKCYLESQLLFCKCYLGFPWIVHICYLAMLTNYVMSSKCYLEFPANLEPIFAFAHVT